MSPKYAVITKQVDVICSSFVMKQWLGATYRCLFFLTEPTHHVGRTMQRASLPVASKKIKFSEDDVNEECLPES
jgi:hypothetical protein